MAEFQEVMQQLNRMCLSFPTCGDGCPIFDECGNVGNYSSDPKHSMQLEKTVMKWAAEHPKPIYQTWGEYLHTLHNEPSSRELSRPIPADIAEKLGIKPKEI